MFIDLVVGATAGLLGLSGLRCLDVWMHLRTGAIIWETGSIPTVDTLSHTRAGSPWVTHEWGFELPLFGLWQLGGDTAMVLVQASLAALAFAVLVRACLAGGASRTGAAVAGIFGAAVASSRFLPRPHMISAVFAALFLSLCLGAREPGNRRIWWAVPVTLIWANVHAGVVMGLLLLGVFAAEEAWRLRAPGRLAMVTVASAVVSLCNPNGWSTLWYPFFLVRSNDQGLFDILELRRPDWPSPVHLYVAVLVIAAALAWRRAGAAPLALAAIGAVLGLTRIRASLDLAVYGAPVLALGITQVEMWIRARSPVSRVPRIPGFVAATGASAAMLVALDWRPSLQVDPWAIPAGAMEFVSREQVDGEMLNAHAFGAWLLWAWPGNKVFFDGRNEVFVDLFREVDKTPIDTLADRYHLGYALIEYPSEHDVAEVDVPLDITDELVTNPHWALVYFDDVARLYVRDLPANVALVATHAYRYVRPGWADFAYIQRYLGNAEEAAAFEVEARRAVAEAPSAVMPRMHLVELLRLSGRTNEALTELDAINADDPYVISRRGALLLQAGRVTDARDALTRAAALDPESATIWSNLGLARMQSTDVAGAITALRKAVELDPELMQARANLALALERSGDTAGAQRLQQETTETSARLARTHFETGQQLLESGFAERAAVELERAAVLSPQTSNVHYLLGVAYNVMGEHGLADTALQRCLSLDRQHPFALLELAEARRGLGRIDESRQLLEAFLASGPDARWGQVAQTRLGALNAKEGAP